MALDLKVKNELLNSLFSDYDTYSLLEFGPLLRTCLKTEIKY